MEVGLSMAIHFLPADRFLGAQPDTASQEGVSGATFRGLIEVTEGMPPVIVYIKAYPVKHGDRDHSGLLNEAIGYVMAQELGIAVPKFAGFIAINNEEFPVKPEWMESEGVTVAWFSLDERGASLKSLIPIPPGTPRPLLEAKLRQLVDALASNVEQAARMIAFDDVLANTDRNTGNIIKTGTQLIAIDHGIIFGSPAWLPEEIDPSLEYENKLLSLLGATGELLPFKAQIVAQHAALSADAPDAVDVLSEILLDELNLSDSIVNAISGFISGRRNTEIAKRIGMLA